MYTASLLLFPATKQITNINYSGFRSSMKIWAWAPELSTTLVRFASADDKVSVQCWLIVLSFVSFLLCSYYSPVRGQQQLLIFS